MLRTDASQVGVGMVLYQIHRETPESEPVYQVILFASQKFSDQAKRWATIEQEAYAVFWAVKTCEFYLRFKYFVLETDHANLQWMEASLVSKIIRWRIYLQGFNFMLRHIAGKKNGVADWLSRNHEIADEPAPAPDMLVQCLSGMGMDEKFDAPDLRAPLAFEPSATVAADQPAQEEHAAPAEPSQPPLPPEELIAQVHGGRMGHHGARKTWKLLNEHFPGHKLPLRIVEEFVTSCAVARRTA